MAFSDVENAVRTWVKTASGLDDAHVFFSDQDVSRPDALYVTIRFAGLAPMGAVDPISTSTLLTRPLGQEVELRVEGLRDLTVTVQVFAAPTVASPNASAVETLNKVAMGIYLPSVRAALDEAGCSPFRVGNVMNLGQLLGTAFEGRASLEVHFYTMLTLSEYTGYIATVDGAGVVDGHTNTYEVP